jgi:hypothetical protein
VQGRARPSGCRSPPPAPARADPTGTRPSTDDPRPRPRPVPLPGPGTQPMHSDLVQPERHPLPHRRHPAAGQRQAGVALPLQRSNLDGDLRAGAPSNVAAVPPPIRPPTHRHKPLPATLLVPQNAASTRLPPPPHPICARHRHNHPPRPPRLRSLRRCRRIADFRDRSPDCRGGSLALRGRALPSPPSCRFIAALSECGGKCVPPPTRRGTASFDWHRLAPPGVHPAESCTLAALQAGC